MRTTTVFIACIVAFFILPSKAYSKRFNTYQNKRYHYSLKYPSSWFLGYLGASEDKAVVLRVCSDMSDAQFSEGGAFFPFVEVMVSDLKELKALGAKLPGIRGAREWLDWERSNWDAPEKERIGPYTDETINIGGYEGIRTTYQRPPFPDAGPLVEVTLFNPHHGFIYSIKYVGIQPAYGENIKVFEKILEGFLIPGK